MPPPKYIVYNFVIYRDKAIKFGRLLCRPLAQGVSHTTLRVLIPPNFRTTPPASYLDNPPNISQGEGVLNIIITFAKYEQYLVYVMFILDSDGGYLFIECCIK